ncbi:MAG: hypothetical protein ACJAVN_000353 [Roseivirga sp.]|jgi:hypothetical protein
MLKSTKLKLSPLSFIFLLALILLQSCGSDDTPTFDEQSADFDSLTLPGTYDITFASVDDGGTQVYEFNVNGSVLINYFDGTIDTENWSVTSNGQLAITGTVDDLFTLTSGDQSSGTIRVVLHDEDDTINTTGTINIQ